MLNENVIPHLSTAFDLKRQVKMDVSISRHKFRRIKGSIRELELMATNLHRDGDYLAAEEIDKEIMAILEKKICRKIIHRSRKEQKFLNMGPT